MKKLWILVAGALVASTVSATLVHFTPDEGYVQGEDLTDDANWAGNYGGFKIGSDSNLVPNADFKGNIFNEEVPVSSGQTVESSIVFSFTDQSVRGANAYLVSIAAFTNVSLTGSMQYKAYFRRSGADNYVVGLDLGSQTFIADPNLGVELPNDVDLVSDTLKLTMKIVSGASSDTVTAILENLDTGFSESYSSTAAKLDSLYFGLMSEKASGEMDMSIDSFEVIPEPATLGMVGISSVCMLLLRRLRIAF